MHTHLLDPVKEIVYSAGKLIQNVEEIPETKIKSGFADFVTKYDSMVQAFLVKELSALLPEARFLGEEDGMTDTSADDGYLFIIDPIDGTTNFICDFQCSGISVGLAYNRELILGVVYNPFRDEMFYAQKGCGAFLNGKQLFLRDRGPEEGVVIFGSSAYYPELRDAAFEAAKTVSYHTMDLREIGSAALGICYVACNRSVAYLSFRLSVWDYAAAAVILKEAGGVLSDFSGGELRLRTKLPVIAATPKGQRELLRLIPSGLY